MADEAYLMSKRFLEVLKTVIRRVLAEMSNTDAVKRRVYEPGAEWQGLTTSILNPPTTTALGWTNPTTCTFQPYRVDPTSVTTPKAMIPSTTDGPFTIVNRDRSLRVPVGTYVRIKRIDGDWMITWAAC
ncbi:hypothetical protein [Schlesneria paludicola]|uniref:hypothetical protein n=1 Tax=Schlesneria paludicola TaxID=360056 RepID=UPI00029B4931|nr:hypothetical protein [Schlesneria paludicola]